MQENAFSDLVLQQVPAQPPSYPLATYDPDGDCIEFLISNESFYAQRVDCLTTIYYGQESNEIVGSLIKGIRNFFHQVLERVPGFEVDIQSGRVRLHHIFTAKLWAEKEAEPNETYVYRVLRQKAEEANTEVEVGDMTE